MELVHSLEKTLSEWYAKAPHLPAEARKWLADNVWWLAIVGVVLSVFGALSIIGIVFAAFGISAMVATTAYSPYVATAFGAVWLAALVGLASIVATAVLLLMAVSPLKIKAKKGWTLLFIVALVSLALQVVSGLVTFDLGAIVVSVLWSAVGAYFLFEIHEYFGAKTKVAAKAPAKTAAAKK